MNTNPAIPPVLPSADVPARFPALRTVATILRVFTWIVVAGALFVGVIVAVNGKFVALVPAAIVAAIAWLTGMIVPELIYVLLAIEENTRQRADR